jgi:acyl-coenzyme A thioesterase PaaI-like protein
VDDELVARLDVESVMTELGLIAEVVGDDIHGRARIAAPMLVPDTDCLRTSVLAAWTDTLIGFLSVAAVAPRVPVTLDLSVDLHRLPRAVTEVTGLARVLKAGKSVLTAEVDFRADGEPIGVAMAAFVVEPKGVLRLPSPQEVVAAYSARVSVMTAPYAERADCRRERPGVAWLPMSPETLNATGTMNGGLIALAVEEAVLSAAPGTALSALTLRYLRPGRIGPFVATADLRGDLATVEVRDTGSDNRVVIVATARVSPLARG